MAFPPIMTTSLVTGSIRFYGKRPGPCPPLPFSQTSTKPFLLQIRFPLYHCLLHVFQKPNQRFPKTYFSFLSRAPLSPRFSCPLYFPPPSSSPFARVMPPIVLAIIPPPFPFSNLPSCLGLESVFAFLQQRRIALLFPNFPLHRLPSFVLFSAATLPPTPPSLIHVVILQFHSFAEYKSVLAFRPSFLNG